MDSQENYKPTYGKLFNVLFHIGVIINVALVVWLYLLFFGVI
jgi:hypothetical protein